MAAWPAPPGSPVARALRAARTLGQWGAGWAAPLLAVQGPETAAALRFASAAEIVRSGKKPQG